MLSSVALEWNLRNSLNRPNCVLFVRSNRSLYCANISVCYVFVQFIIARIQWKWSKQTLESLGPVEWKCVTSQWNERLASNSSETFDGHQVFYSVFRKICWKLEEHEFWMHIAHSFNECNQHNFVCKMYIILNGNRIKHLTKTS